MYEDVKEQFKEVIIHSQGIPNPKLDILFSKWEKAKEKFIKRFGGLIYEWPEQIEFSLDEREKKVRASEFATVVHDSFNNPSLAGFIDANADGFFDNKIVSADEFKIPKEMKLIKAFKFFENDKKKLRAIQDYASSYIQENKIKGTLCFSVHPLDFLSSSENSYNWRSCHSLDGEYRAGNLSYMLDKSTFMVYLKGSENKKLPAFGGIEWNSKKWRMLIHASDDDGLIFAGRQYPFSSKTGIDTVLNIYNNLLFPEFKEHSYPFYVSKYYSWRADYIDCYVPYDAPPGSEPHILNGKYLVFDGQLLEINQVIREGYNALNYNDVLRSSCYEYPYYSILSSSTYYNGINTILKNPIIVGEEVACLHCGNELISNSETMRCDDCEIEYGFEENDTYSSCACCGARIYVDDAACVGENDEYVCDSCYSTECFVCECCEEVYFNTEKMYIPGNNEDEGYWYCKHCYEDYYDNRRGY